MPKPNFFVIGTFKGGTTSLYAYLSQHPDIYMPSLKEPRYFAYDPENIDHQKAKKAKYPIRSLAEYLSLFRDASQERAIGEASPVYLDSPIAASRIAEFNPEARIIFSLRDPVERAFSGYQMWVRSGEENRSIDLAMQPGERWVEGSFYAEKVQRYYDHFSSNQIKALLFEDLVDQPDRVMQDLYGFLGVNQNFSPDTSKSHNVGGHPRIRVLRKPIHQLKIKLRGKRHIARLTPNWLRNAYYAVRNKNLERIAIPKHIDQKLAEYFVNDAEQVGRITGLNTDSWRLQERAKVTER